MKRQTIVIPADELMDIHCKTYIQKSFDKAIKMYQTNVIRSTGANITYSEAVRRVMEDGLRANGINLERRAA